MTELCIPVPKNIESGDVILSRQRPPQKQFTLFELLVQRLLGRKSNDENICKIQLSIHPRKSIVAACMDGFLISLYDLQGQEWSSEVKLQHNYLEYGNILCMKWNKGSNSLLIGTTRGICVWNFGDMVLKSSPGADTTQPWIRFLPHPRNHAVNDLDSCPLGRLLVSISHDDSVPLVWDYMLGTCTSLYCLSGALGKSVTWANSGGITITAQ